MPEIPGDKMRVSFGPHVTMGQLLDGVEYCTINPTANREVEMETMPKPKGSRKVLVVGGGPSGMEAARVAAQSQLSPWSGQKQATAGHSLFSQAPELAP